MLNCTWIRWGRKCLEEKTSRLLIDKFQLSENTNFCISVKKNRIRKKAAPQKRKNQKKTLCWSCGYINLKSIKAVNHWHISAWNLPQSSSEDRMSWFPFFLTLFWANTDIIIFKNMSNSSDTHRRRSEFAEFRGKANRVRLDHLSESREWHLVEKTAQNNCCIHYIIDRPVGDET